MRSIEGKQRFLIDITSCIGNRVGPELSVGATESTAVFDEVPFATNLQYDSSVNILMTLLAWQSFS